MKTKSLTKLTNKIYDSDVIRVIDSAVEAEYEAEWMTTMMLHTIMDPTA